MPVKKSKYMRDKEYRKRIKASVKKYQESEKGIATRKRAMAKLKEKKPDYIKNYMKDRRKWADANNICLRCFKRKQLKGIKTCKICHDKEMEKQAKYRKKNSLLINKNMKKRREIAKEKGICIKCFKRTALPGKSQCAMC